jgi:pimeloyl-ACP methyl ester carboxylesterase
MFSWRYFVAPFSQDHKLILVDFKGSGKSPKPRDNHYSIEDKADDTFNLIVTQNLMNVTLVGNSLGGGVALLVAVRLSEQHPERLSKLILIDSAGDKRYIPLYVKLVRSFFGAPIIYLTPSKFAARMALRTCYYQTAKATKDLVDAYAAPMSSRAGRYALLRTIRQCIPANADELIEKAATITVPTLIIWGRQDRVIPLVVGELLHKLIPHSVLKIIEECGHIPQEEKPDETIALISQFLSQPTRA